MIEKVKLAWGRAIDEARADAPDECLENLLVSQWYHIRRLCIRGGSFIKRCGSPMVLTEILAGQCVPGRRAIVRRAFFINLAGKSSGCLDAVPLFLSASGLAACGAA